MEYDLIQLNLGRGKGLLELEHKLWYILNALALTYTASHTTLRVELGFNSLGFSVLQVVPL